jgi:hypothetical protein
MRHPCFYALFFLLLWGCAAARPQREIEETFRAFLGSLETGDLARARETAPFLDDLPGERRDAAIRSFRLLGNGGPGTRTRVVRGSEGSYLLYASAPDRSEIAVPFHRNALGNWEMSPVLEAVQHIDIIPARE